MATKQRWPSHMIFLLASIGFAAGLGNLWRFPMLAYRYGGGAFILALIICNIVVIYPLMLFEMGIGQKYRAGAPMSIERFRKGMAWSQWIPILAQVFILMYYMLVFGWSLVYLVESLRGEFLKQPSTYFTDSILQQSANISQPDGIRWVLLAGLFAGYLLVYICMRGGLRSISKVVRYTATAPFLLLFILLIRGVTLPGAGVGLSALLIPDGSALLDLSLWREALGQSFFSSGLAFGYYTMAAGYREDRAEIPRAGLVILVGNLAVSLLAGAVVFSTLGFMAHQQGVPLAEVTQGGPMLVFSAFPTAIAEMPFFAQGFAFIFFLMVVSLAIDSIFGAIKCVTAAFADLWGGALSEHRLTVIILVIAFLGGIPLTTGAGSYYLDVMDHYLGGYLFMLVGAIEAVIAAWIVGTPRVRAMINECSGKIRIGRWYDWVMRVIPLLVGGLFLYAISGEFQQLYGGYPLWTHLVFGALPLLVVIVMSIWLGKRIGQINKS